MQHDAAAGQYGALNPSCEKEYPALRGVTGWRANGIAIELVDSDGTVAYALDNAGPDVFAASIDGAEFTLDIMPESTPAIEKQLRRMRCRASICSNR